MIYSLIKLGKRGADFYLDFLYLSYFSSEHIQDKIDSWSYVTHMEASLQILKEGIESYLTNN